jgi:hypothetical protein
MTPKLPPLPPTVFLVGGVLVGTARTSGPHGDLRRSSLTTVKRVASLPVLSLAAQWCRVLLQ